MNPKKKTTSTPGAASVPLPATGGAAPTKRSDIYNPYRQDPKNALNLPSMFTINTPIPVATNTSTEPTVAFKPSSMK